MRWSTLFYGLEGQGWFLGFHCLARYVKVAFLNDASRKPPPPVESKDPNTRYLHVHEGEPFDERQFAAWIRQAVQRLGAALF